MHTLYAKIRHKIVFVQTGGFRRQLEVMTMWAHCIGICIHGWKGTTVGLLQTVACKLTLCYRKASGQKTLSQPQQAPVGHVPRSQRQLPPVPQPITTSDSIDDENYEVMDSSVYFFVRLLSLFQYLNTCLYE